MRVVVSGGGSAGHILPTLATADALKSLDSDIAMLYVGQSGGMEAKIVAASGLEFLGITAGKFRRNHFDRGLARYLNVSTLGPNIVDSFKFLKGTLQAIAVLRKFAPDVVFLKGGFVCLPVGLAAKILGIPFVIHESDVTPGLTNKILSRWANKIAVGFPVKHYPTLDRKRLEYVGSPVRPDLVGAHRLEGLAHFGLAEDIPVVLITGGSQGAAQINQAVLEGLEGLVDRFQVIHQTGELELGRITFALRNRKDITHLDRYHPYGFLLTDMNLALAAADVVVGRAGVNTINDSAALAKPTILIPNSAMAGHQVENARVLSRLGAVRVLDSDTLTGDKLVRELAKIVDDESEQARLSTAIAAFARPSAAHDLAQLVIELGRNRATKQKPNTEASNE